MILVFNDPDMTDEERRGLVYDGHLFLYQEAPATRGFADFTWDLIREAFGSIDPLTAQDELSVEDFVAIIAPLKTKFTHHPGSKEWIGRMLTELGCDPEDTYFDIPRMRISTHSGYLTAGAGYVYQAHRDSWYGAPAIQTNWWIPVTELTFDNGLAFFPPFWSKPIENDSAGFDVYEWNANGRLKASTFIKKDTRNHPRALADVPRDSEVRVMGRRGSVLIFAGTHLHASVPNTSGRTRMSLDFRTVSRADLEARRAPALIDNASTGTTLRDFMRVSDHERLPEDLVESYDSGDPSKAVAVFDPSALEQASER